MDMHGMKSRHPILWRRLGGPGENVYVVWVGRQLSMLGGKKPIATKRCDRRRATINSCASREIRNPSQQIGGRAVLLPPESLGLPGLSGAAALDAPGLRIS